MLIWDSHHPDKKPVASFTDENRNSRGNGTSKKAANGSICQKRYCRVGKWLTAENRDLLLASFI